MAITPENRETLKHLLNISFPYNFDDPTFIYINDGVTELSEELNVDTDSVHYIGEKNAITSIKSYAPSISITSFYLKETTPGLNKWMRNIIYNQPTGRSAETDYIRFNILDTEGADNKYRALRFNAVASASSLGGAGGDNPTMVVDLGAVGDPIQGIVTMNGTGNSATYTFEATGSTTYTVTFKYTGVATGENVHVRYGNTTKTGTATGDTTQDIITFNVPKKFDALYMATSEGKREQFGHVETVNADKEVQVNFA